MATLFRKESLDKLSNPEQLDRMVVIMSASSWIAILGAAILIIVAIIWSVFGRLPQKVSSSGIFLNEGSISTCYAKTNGVVVKSNVKSGDEVKKGELMFVVANEEAYDKLDKLDDKIEAIEGVTLVSKDDEITSENQEIIKIKSELQNLDTSQGEEKLTLKLYEQQYEGIKKLVDELNIKKENVKKSYYDKMLSSNNSQIEYEYSNANSDYQTSKSAYESAKANFTSYTVTRDDYQAQMNYYKKLYDEANKKYKSYLKKYDDGDTSADTQSNLNTYKAYADSYYSSYISYKSNYESAKNSVKKCTQLVGEAEKALNNSKKIFESKKAIYEKNISTSAEKSEETNKLNEEYQKVSNEYNTAKAELNNMKTQIDIQKLKVQISNNNVEKQRKALETQFELAKSSAISQLKSEKDNYTAVLDKNEVVATEDGIIYSTSIGVGSAVNAGMEMAKIKTVKEKGNEVVLYMNLADGKKVEKDMVVKLYPTTSNRSEHGHISGKVISVADYVSSSSDLLNELGDQSLVNIFTSNGPVLAVTVELDKDDSTVSGFKWSSKKGEALKVIEGTLMAADIIVENKAPITMVIPLLKEKLSSNGKS